MILFNRWSIELAIFCLFFSIYLRFTTDGLVVHRRINIHTKENCSSSDTRISLEPSYLAMMVHGNCRRKGQLLRIHVPRYIWLQENIPLLALISSIIQRCVLHPKTQFEFSWCCDSNRQFPVLNRTRLQRGKPIIVNTADKNIPRFARSKASLIVLKTTYFSWHRKVISKLNLQ